MFASNFPHFCINHPRILALFGKNSLYCKYSEMSLQKFNTLRLGAVAMKYAVLLRLILPTNFYSYFGYFYCTHSGQFQAHLDRSRARRRAYEWHSLSVIKRIKWSCGENVNIAMNYLYKKISNVGLHVVSTVGLGVASISAWEWPPSMLQCGLPLDLYSTSSPFGPLRGFHNGLCGTFIWSSTRPPFRPLCKLHPGLDVTSIYTSALPPFRPRRDLHWGLKDAIDVSH